MLGGIHMNDFKNLQKRLGEIQATLDNLDSLTPADWGELSEEQQADMIRDVVTVRNVLNATSDRYYDF